MERLKRWSVFAQDRPGQHCVDGALARWRGGTARGDVQQTQILPRRREAEAWLQLQHQGDRLDRAGRRPVQGRRPVHAARERELSRHPRLARRRRLGVLGITSVRAAEVHRRQVVFQIGVLHVPGESRPVEYCLEQQRQRPAQRPLARSSHTRRARGAAAIRQAHNLWLPRGDAAQPEGIFADVPRSSHRRPVVSQNDVHYPFSGERFRAARRVR